MTDIIKKRINNYWHFQKDLTKNPITLELHGQKGEIIIFELEDFEKIKEIINILL